MLSSTFLFNGGKRRKRRKGTENDYLTRASLTIAKNGEECSSFLPFLPILQLTIAKLAGTKRNKRELDNHRVLSEKRGRGYDSLILEASSRVPRAQSFAAGGLICRAAKDRE